MLYYAHIYTIYIIPILAYICIIYTYIHIYTLYIGDGRVVALPAYAHTTGSSRQGAATDAL